MNREVEEVIRSVALISTEVSSCAQARVRRQELESVDLICVLLGESDRQIAQWRSFELPRKPLRIGLASHANPAQAKHAYEQGFDDYLPLTIGSWGIQKALERHLKGKVSFDAKTYAQSVESFWFESSSYGVLHLSARGQIEAANPTAMVWFRSYGYSNLLGLSCTDVFGYDLYQLRKRASLLITDENGRRVSLGARISSLAEPGDPRFLLVLSREPSPGEQLFSAASNQEAYLAEVNHELRTPLSSIMGSLSLLSSQALGPVSESIGELIDVALRNSVRLSQLVDDILDVNKIDADHLFLRLSDVRIFDLLLETIQINQSYSADIELQLVGTIESDLTVHLDPNRFGQVMTNLISNAMKYSPAGGKVDVSIQTHCADGIQEVVISIQDYGRGIAPDTLERMFLKYPTADEQQSASMQSNGLGLYITKRLVEKMGGTISVHSSLGSGTTFTVCFRQAIKLATKDITELSLEAT